MTVYHIIIGTIHVYLVNHNNEEMKNPPAILLSYTVTTTPKPPHTDPEAGQ